MVRQPHPGQQQIGGPLPFRIVMAGVDMTDPNTNHTRAIVTQGGIVERGSYQFLHTLNETIYAYVFGDRIGELRISGICFADPCDGSKSGMQQVIETYRDNRISRSGEPVQVSFGEVNYVSFLVGMTLDITDSEHNLGQWSFSFNTFPGGR